MPHSRPSRGSAARQNQSGAQWKPVYGEDYPDTTCPPDHFLTNGSNQVIDGVTFEARDYGAGGGAHRIDRGGTNPARSVRRGFDLQPCPSVVGRRGARCNGWPSLTDWRRKSRIIGLSTPAMGRRAASRSFQRSETTSAIFRGRTQAAVTNAGLSQDETQSVVEGTRQMYPGWALEMLIPINARAVAQELAPPGTK